MSDPTAAKASTSIPATSVSAGTPARDENRPAAPVTTPVTTPSTTPGATGATASPTTGPSPIRAPVAEPVGDVSDERVEAFTRLLIGAALEASDELWLRLRLWQEQARAATTQARPETAADRLRYALVGLVFEAEERIPARLRQMQQASVHRTERLMNRVTPVGRRLMAGPLRPLRLRLERGRDEMGVRLTAARERWTARGRLDERQARLLARLAVTSLTDELFEGLEHNRAMQEFIQDLITQQGTGLATTAVETARERTQAADDWVERMVHGVFKRPLHEQRTTEHPVDAPPSSPPIEVSHSE
jgi:hypothetical protein